MYNTASSRRCSHQHLLLGVVAPKVTKLVVKVVNDAQKVDKPIRKWGLDVSRATWAVRSLGLLRIHRRIDDVTLERLDARAILLKVKGRLWLPLLCQPCIVRLVENLMKTVNVSECRTCPYGIEKEAIPRCTWHIPLLIVKGLWNDQVPRGTQSHQCDRNTY